MNGQVSEQKILPQAGLPQALLLSPVLFLFFNADLVQKNIDKNGGAMAFLDDFTAWVTGPTAAANREGIQAIIDQAIDWKKIEAGLSSRRKDPPSALYREHGAQ